MTDITATELEFCRVDPERGVVPVDGFADGFNEGGRDMHRLGRELGTVAAQQVKGRAFAHELLAHKALMEPLVTFQEAIEPPCTPDELPELVGAYVRATGKKVGDVV